MSAPYATIEQLSDQLNISPQTARAWVRQGIISKDTYIHVGTTYRFNMDAVMASLHKRTHTESGTDGLYDPTGSPVQLELDLDDNQ